LRAFLADHSAQAFAYSGTELVGLAAAESKNPLKALPKATKQVLFRVAFFYVVNLLIVGLNVPYNNPQLLGSPGSAASAVGVDVKASPFVIAIEFANIKVLPSIINAVIMMATLSVANSCTYGSTRTLQALALTGRAPKIFNYVDRKGRPLWCVVLQVAVGFIAYIQLASTGLTVFDWLLAIGSLAALIMYFSINVSHIRFRRAMKLQNRDIGEIPWKSPLGVWGSYVGAFLCALCILGVFYSALYVSLLVLKHYLTDLRDLLTVVPASGGRHSVCRRVLRNFHLRAFRSCPLRVLEGGET